jgi:hypothetical protein
LDLSQTGEIVDATSLMVKKQRPRYQSPDSQTTELPLKEYPRNGLDL